MAASTCVICDGSHARACPTCYSISYCSSECQDLDWPLHRRICRTFNVLDPRPSPSHKLAILFPVDSEHPQLIWVMCERRFDEDDKITYEMPAIEHILDSENLNPGHGSCAEIKPMTRNALRGISLGYTVQVNCRDSFLVDGSSSNLCVENITGGRMTHDWRGPIVAMRQPGTAVDPLVYEDVSAAELRVVVDYFLSY